VRSGVSRRNTASHRSREVIVSLGIEGYSWMWIKYRLSLVIGVRLPR
jgi:hypothetical protein